MEYRELTIVIRGESVDEIAERIPAAIEAVREHLRWDEDCGRDFKGGYVELNTHQTKPLPIRRFEYDVASQ